MYKISYSSLDEVWGEKEKSDPSETNPYQILKEQSEKNRLNVVDNLNLMERDMQNQNVMKATGYGNYNSWNSSHNSSVEAVVKENKTEKDINIQSMNKSELLEKLLFLENQIKKYNERLAPYDRIETFGNQGPTQYPYNSFFSCDIFDLIVLICIGLFIIFVMDSIFKMGKNIGSSR